MKEYNIDGHVLRISDEQFNYFEWSEQLVKARKEFIESYEEKYKHYDYKYNENGEKQTIIDILDVIFDDFDECSKPIVERIIDDARKHDIYDMTPQTFNDTYVEHSTEDFECLQEVFDEIDKVYNKMTGNHMERRINNASRGRIVGGGFGLSGAVKGMVTAKVMNSVADAYYERKMQNAEADDYRECIKMLDNIKKSDNTWEIITKCIHNYVFDIMWGYRKLQEAWGKIIESSIDGDKCEALLSSAEAVPEKAREIGLQALEADPTNHNVYQLLLTTVGDPDNELEKAALEIAKFDLHKIKLYMIEKSLMSFDYTALANYPRFYEIINKVSLMYGLDPDKYIKCIENVEKNYEESKYYFGGRKYATTEEALQAKEDNEKFCNYIKNVDWNSEKDLNSLISWIEQELKSDLKAQYIEDVKGKIETVSKNHRTVNGIEYASFEDAENKRNAYRTIKNIVNKEYKTIEELNASKNLLSEIQDDELSGKAQKIIDEIHECFDMCNRTVTDVLNTESRVEMNKILNNAIMTKRMVNEFNVYESKFEEWYMLTYKNYLNINGMETKSTTDADNKYFETIDKALKYQEYLAKNNGGAEKKGFFSKIASGVKDALQKSNETAYNWITANGTKEIPNISVEDKIMMLDNNKKTYSSNNETLKFVEQIKKIEVDICKIKVNNNAYILKKKDLDTEELRKYINSMCEKCVLAPTSDKNKTVCYNVSLSSGEYAVMINKPKDETEINLGSFGLYNISLKPFDTGKVTIVENCSREVAAEVVKHLKELDFKAYIVNLHYMIGKEEAKNYRIMDYKTASGVAKEFYVVLRCNSVFGTPSYYGLLHNYELFHTKYNLYDNNTMCNYGSNYVILAKYDSLEKAKEVCEKMMGKGLLSDATSLDDELCEFGIIADTNHNISNKLKGLVMESDSSKVDNIDCNNVKDEFCIEDNQEDVEVVENIDDKKDSKNETTEAKRIAEKINNIEKQKASGDISEDDYYDELNDLVDYVTTQGEIGEISKEEANHLTDVLFEKLGI